MAWPEFYDRLAQLTAAPCKHNYFFWRRSWIHIWYIQCYSKRSDSWIFLPHRSFFESKGVLSTNGQAIIKLWSSHPISTTHTLLPFSKSQLDITDSKSISLNLPNQKVDVLINTAAYTDVNGAESNQEICYNANCLGPTHLSKWAKNQHANLLQVSTDFVFDGNISTPYDVCATPNPINMYGLAKQKGEFNVLKELPQNSSILRNKNSFYCCKVTYFAIDFQEFFLKRAISLS